MFISSPVFAEILKMEATVNVDALNVRQSNDAKSNIVTSLKKGSKIKLTGTDDEKVWYKVDYYGKTGWVDKKYVF